MKNFYLNRFGIGDELISSPINQEVSTIVVVPSFSEPNIVDAVKSLVRSVISPKKFEIIIVINHGENAADNDKKQNLESEEALRTFISSDIAEIPIYIVTQYNMHNKHAGVGLARKLGMDEAVRRFGQINKPEGLILCFDADCDCSSGFLSIIDDFFRVNRKVNACSIHFEHRLDDKETSNENREAIIDYELHLRYYLNALRWSGHPHAYHTIGSSMAVRSLEYQKAGGMNRKKAGEDFYFLQKIIPNGNFADISEAVVYPSARASHRVPFGTGKAVADILKNEKQFFETYSIEVFRELKSFFGSADLFFNKSEEELCELLSMVPLMVQFLTECSGIRAIAEISSQVASKAQFTNRFFRYFNLFKTLKYVHFATENKFPKVNVQLAATKLLTMTEEVDFSDNYSLLMNYRNIDKDIKNPLTTQ